MGAGVNGVKLGNPPSDELDDDSWDPAQYKHRAQLDEVDEQIKSATKISDLDAPRTTMNSVWENVRRQEESLRRELGQTDISETRKKNWLKFPLRNATLLNAPHSNSQLMN